MQIEFNQGETKYLIDTSALIVLDITFKADNPVFVAVWEEIEDLIGNGCFKTLDFVEDEINNYEGKEDYLKKWVHKWRKHFVLDTDSETINAAKPIINSEYSSGFFDAKKQAEGKEEADPYLIAYSKVHEYVLITNESKTKQNKIPAVSKKYDVKCIDINEFLIERGMRMKRSPKK